jgi:hypothetical protein
MKADAIQVRSYFAPPVNSHWRWQEACGVVAWSDGPTITFRDELERLISCLARQGLPRSRCQDRWQRHWLDSSTVWQTTTFTAPPRG